MINTRYTVRHWAVLLPSLLLIATFAACNTGGAVSYGDPGATAGGDTLERDAEPQTLSLFDDGRCGVNIIRGDADAYMILNNTILESNFAFANVILDANLDDIVDGSVDLSDIGHMAHSGTLSAGSILHHIDGLIDAATGFPLFPEQIGESNPVGLGCLTAALTPNPDYTPPDRQHDVEGDPPMAFIGEMTAVIDGVERGEETLRKIVELLNPILGSMGGSLDEIPDHSGCYGMETLILCEYDRYILMAGGNPHIVNSDGNLANIQIMMNNVDANISASSSLTGSEGTFFNGSPLGDMIPALIEDDVVPQMMLVADMDALQPGFKDDMNGSTIATYLSRDLDVAYIGISGQAAVKSDAKVALRIFTPTDSEVSIFGVSKEILGGDDLWGSYAGYYDIRFNIGLDISTLLPSVFDISSLTAPINDEMIEQLVAIESLLIAAGD